MTVEAQFDKAMFSETLRAILKGRKIKQIELANKMEVAPNTVVRWCSSRHSMLPSLPQFFSLCHVLAVSPLQFFGRYDPTEDYQYQEIYNDQARLLKAYDDYAMFTFLVDMIMEMPEEKIDKFGRAIMELKGVLTN